MKGFTLIELIVAAVIIGALATIAITNYATYTEQTNTQGAEHNLLAISAAQENYFESNNSTYCTAACGNNAGNLSANLNLHLSSNDPFYNNYSCTAVGSLYKCTTNDGTNTVTLNVTTTNGTTTGATLSCTLTGSGATITCP